MKSGNAAKWTVSFGRGAAAAAVVNALLTVAKEKSPALLAALQRLTGHHWISHALIVLAVFFGCGFLTVSDRRTNLEKSTRLLVAAMAGAALLIAAFYLTEAAG